MYNFLITGNSGAWDEIGYEFPRDRLGEYTDATIKAKYYPLDAAAIEQLKSFPTLFGYEGTKENVRVGYIRRIKDRGKTIYIEYEFEPRIPHISFSKIIDLKTRLDIQNNEQGYGEFSRTHWAIKDENLFEILFNAGLIDHSFLISTVRLGRVEDLKFKVALSFPGEKRDYVSELAIKLKRLLPPASVFYDKDFTAQLARPNLDTILQKIYRSNSELVVVFVSKEYEKKEWCGLEWRAVREIIMEKRDHSLMVMRFDNTVIEGLSKLDGYIDLNEFSLDDAVNFIVERVQLNDFSPQIQTDLLQHENDRKPNLVGSVKDIQIYPVLDRAGKNILGTRISLYLGIANASIVPTTISDFILDVANTDGAHFLGYAGHDPSKFGFLQRECINSDGALSDINQRLADRFSNGQKAELGERHEGYLFFDFDMIQNPDEKFEWSNNIILKVIDAFDEKHQINGGLLKKYDKKA